MAKSKPRLSPLLLFILTFIFATLAMQEFRGIQATIPYQEIKFSKGFSPTPSELPVQGKINKDSAAWTEKKKNSNTYGTTRRMLIGSTAPTCTYNECRGCRFRCRAEQVPVEGNDPINSAYHYRCICHR